MSSITLTTVVPPAFLNLLQPEVRTLTLRLRPPSDALQQSAEDSQFLSELEWLEEQSDVIFSSWNDPLSRNIHDWILRLSRAHENTQTVTPEVERQVKEEISHLVNTVLVDSLHAEPLKKPYLFRDLTWHKWKFDEYMELVLSTTPEGDEGQKLRAEKLQEFSTVRPHLFAQTLLTRIAQLPERLRPAINAPSVSLPASSAESLVSAAAGVGASGVVAARPVSSVVSTSLSVGNQLMTYEFLIRSAASRNRSRQITQFAAVAIPTLQDYEERTRASVAAHVRRFQQETREHEQKINEQMSVIDEAHRKKEGYLKGQIAEARSNLAVVSSKLSQAEAALHRQSSEIASLREANAQRRQEVQYIRVSGGGGGGCVIL